jgi:secreted trypsin-like serine protease
VISPTALVTAAHCVDAANHPGYDFGAFLGDDASAYSSAAQLQPVLVPASAVHVHPQYDSSSPFTADIAVVELAQPVSPAPLPLQRAPLDSSWVGRAARMVGYGQTVYGTFNTTKYDADTTVASVPGDDTVQVGDATAHTCVGDSGGPALVTVGGVETIIGVDSYTDTSGCTEASHYRRVDEYTAFLDPYVPVMMDLSTAPPADLSTAPRADLSMARNDLAQAGSEDLRANANVDARMDASASAGGKHGGCSTGGAGTELPWWLLLVFYRRRSARKSSP